MSKKTLDSGRQNPSKKQVYVFTTYTIVGFFALLVFGGLHILEDNFLLGGLEVIGSGLLLLNGLGLRVLHNFTLAYSGFLLTVMMILLALLVTGGMQGTGIFWFFTFPLGAFFLAGKRQGLWWCIALFISTVMVIILANTLPFPLPYNFVTLQQLLVALGVVTVGIYVYQQSRESLLSQTQMDQQDLQEEKIKGEAVIDNIGEAVIVTDPSGKVMVMNQAAEATFGWELKELKGKQFVDKIAALDKSSQLVAKAMRPIEQSLTDLEKIHATTTYMRKDGSNFLASVDVTPIIVSEKLLGAVSTIRDLGDEHQVDRAKSDFVTLASHQLRTPASAIAWTSELLLSGDVGTLTKDQEEYVEKIYRSNQRLIDLLDDMLTVSSIEVGNFSMTPTLTDVPSMVHRALNAQLKKYHSGQKLHVEESYDAALPDIVTDANAVKTIAQRLISNAIKYTPKGGRITLSVRHSHEHLTPKSKGSLLLEVTDTGFGIPKHQQTKVFTKLFRADNIKKKDTDGTGLGLYITKALVEHMGGKIWFTSEQNKGSRFSVLLPIEGIRKS